MAEIRHVSPILFVIDCAGFPAPRTISEKSMVHFVVPFRFRYFLFDIFFKRLSF